MINPVYFMSLTPEMFEQWKCDMLGIGINEEETSLNWVAYDSDEFEVRR